MDISYILNHLPTAPSEQLIQWTRSNATGDLGGDYMIHTAERVSLAPSMAELLEYEAVPPIKSIWASRCLCTACTEEFITHKITGADAIRMYEGEDGQWYPLDPGEQVFGDGGFVVDVFDGEKMNCPNCLADVELIHSRKLRGGRKKQIMVSSVENIGPYSAFITWLISRNISEFGVGPVCGIPADAYVIAEDGKVAHFSKILWGGSFWCESPRRHWELKPGVTNNLDKRYLDWGSINNKKVGTFFYDSLPDCTGTTGEKTGLYEFLAADGWNPLDYLRLWQKCKGVENLVKAGHAGLIKGIIQTAYRFSADVVFEAEKVLDLKEVKPHRMLKMSKEDFRNLQRRRIRIEFDDFEVFRNYRAVGGKHSMPEFLVYKKSFGIAGLRTAIELQREYHDDLGKQARYLEKQGLNHSDIYLLKDARRMAAEIAGERPLTNEEQWPRHLTVTHDRLSQTLQHLKLERQAAEAQKINEGFSGVIERLRGLEWSDGDLCVKLPQSAADLVREGDVLRHCVGGYADLHVRGKDTIFFVRHYRRPERPYYTLDIDMAGRPVEKQLHGYGNEHHGDFKQYTHSIPKRVRAFCDRWKSEVLIPWYVEQQKNKEAKTA